MATTLVVKTQFTAIDKFSNSIKKMTAGVRKFGQTAVVAMNKADRAIRKVGSGINKAIGKFGQLGLAVSAAAILMTAFQANVQLEENLKSLSAITGVTGEQFKAFEKQITSVSKSQKQFAGETAKAFEIVGSAKPELLADAAALGKVTEAAIILSKATGGELAVEADNLTGTLNQFNLAADQSARVINVLAAGSQAGAAPVNEITASMKQFGAVANSLNVSVEESVGLIETLAEKNIKGAEAGTKLRNILTKMATVKALPKGALKELSKFGVNLDIVSDKSLPVSQRLKELSKIGGDATAMFKVFGAENLVAGQVLLKNTDKVDAYTKAVTGTNVATEQAAINGDTVSNKWEELVASFKNATTSTNSNNKALGIIKKTLGFLADNMDILIPVVIGLTAAFAAFKIVMAIVNAVMLASPITWIVLGIVALIAAIAALVIWWEDIVKWVKESNNWFAQLMRFTLTPLILVFKAIGAIISWISEKFSQLIEWVKTSDSGFAKFIRGSLTLLINVLSTIGDFFDWIGEKFSSLVNWVKTSDNWFAKFLRSTLIPIINAFEKLGELWDLLSGTQSATDVIQKAIEAQVNVNSPGENALNPDAKIEEVRTKREESTINNKLKIDITDQSGLAEIVENSGIDVDLTKTVGFGQ
jgi:TP901 family phage tail tape measure protein